MYICIATYEIVYVYIYIYYIHDYVHILYHLYASKHTALASRQ